MVLPQGPEVVVHEDEIVSVARAGTLVHAGVTSCLTVSCVLDDEVVGLHIVQWAGKPPNDTSYQQRLPGLTTTFNQRIHGRAIRYLIIVGPLLFYPDDVCAKVRGLIVGAPGPRTMDISAFTEQGCDVYVIGYADHVRVVRAGKSLKNVKFADL